MKWTDHFTFTATIRCNHNIFDVVLNTIVGNIKRLAPSYHIPVVAAPLAECWQVVGAGCAGRTTIEIRFPGYANSLRSRVCDGLASNGYR